MFSCWIFSLSSCAETTSSSEEGTSVEETADEEVQVTQIIQGTIYLDNALADTSLSTLHERTDGESGYWVEGAAVFIKGDSDNKSFTDENGQFELAIRGTIPTAIPSAIPGAITEAAIPGFKNKAHSVSDVESNSEDTVQLFIWFNQEDGLRFGKRSETTLNNDASTAEDSTIITSLEPTPLVITNGIHGKVLSESGDALENVYVQVEGMPTRSDIQSCTGENEVSETNVAAAICSISTSEGLWDISYLPEGTYYFQFYALGYQACYLEVPVREGTVFDDWSDFFIESESPQYIPILAVCDTGACQTAIQCTTLDD